MTNHNSYRGLARLQDLEVRFYSLTTRSHLRVGAGEGAADVAVENPIIRALVFKGEGGQERVPYVPASSLHGVVRAWVEKALRSGQEPLSRDDMEARIARLDEGDQKNLLDAARSEIAAFLGKDRATDDELYEHWKVYRAPHVCDPLSDVDKCERITDRESQARKWKVAWWGALERELSCTVCRIFGYMGQRGRVKFTHAWPTVKDVPLDVITRVAINRLTGAADEGKLFDLEAIPPGCVFYFFTVLENMEPKQKEHFEMGIRALNLQLAGLGAHSTVGFGMVEVSQVLAADIKPTIFDEKVETIIPEILTSNDYKLCTDLDETKYPQFFRALASVHKQTGQPPKAEFNQRITFQ
jgi:CRISPR/Cas system CSM-associated protein Csm3 (group 7 of RAMP superfamily)